MPSEEQTYREFVKSKLSSLEKTGEETLAQTKKTNGRVNDLERDLDIARARVTTAIVIIAFTIGSVLIPLAGSYIAAGKL
jgi:hypothetical protein